MLQTYEQHSKRKLAATFITIAVIAGVVIFADHAKAHSSSPMAITAHTRKAAPASTTASSSTSTSSSTSRSGYKDGTYSASSDYYVPPGSQTIEVSITLKNGVITNSSVRNSEGDPTSAAFQQDFASSYKSYVVGQKLSSLQIGVIAGASDTTQGFADALSQIANKAQA